MLLIICFIILIFHYSNLPRKFTVIISIIMGIMYFCFLPPTSIESIPAHLRFQIVASPQKTCQLALL